MIAVLSIGQSNESRNEANLSGALKAEYGASSVLIRAAQPDTKIADWQKGQPLYENAIRLTKARIARGYAVVAIFMMHGESDARDGTTYADYKRLFVLMLRNMRDDIGLPDLPVVYGQLGKPSTQAGYSAAAWQAIRAAQADAAAGRLAYNMFSTVQYGPYADGLHYVDNIVQPGFSGTGYKEITYNGFMATLDEVLAVK